MEYQKIIYFLDNTPDQQSKLRTNNLVELNDESRGTYNEDNQIRFKTSMLWSSLCYYSNAYKLVKKTITVTNTAARGQPNNGANKDVIFTNYEVFINCISRINNTQVDDDHDIDVVMPIYNLTEYSELEFYGNVVKTNRL